MIPLPQGGEGNPSDIVEIRADLIVSMLVQHVSSETTKERVDWWLEGGGDDVFVLETDLQLPVSMVSFIHLLLLPSGEWERSRDKGKLPKSKIDGQLLPLILLVLRRRLEEYPTSLEFDAALLSENLALNRRHAVVVRLGEKQILCGAIEKLQALQQVLQTSAGPDNGKKRRGSVVAGGKNGVSKKAKR